jgi:uncharacterized protein
MTGNKNSVEALVVIAALAKRTSTLGCPFSKTTLQRFVYLLKEVYRIDCGYDFTLHTYGPCSTELLQDLDLMDTKGCLKIKYNSARGDYNIEPTLQTDIILKSARSFAKTHEAVENLLGDFGVLDAKALDLLVTILFVKHEALRDRRLIDDGETIGIVRNLKPHFEEEAIYSAMDGLAQKGYLSPSFASAVAQG